MGLEQHSATSAHAPANSSTSTSRSSAGSTAPATASPAAATTGASRLAYAEVLDDDEAVTATGFLRRAVAFYRRHGITVERVLTDNGAAYIAITHAITCRRLGIKHLRTRPYRPQTNRKAEHFIRTLLAGWAYGAIYGSSRERTAALDGWLWHYNHRRKHSALSRHEPVSRTNLLGSYS